jgi:hypothetical protein
VRIKSLAPDVNSKFSNLIERNPENYEYPLRLLNYASLPEGYGSSSYASLQYLEDLFLVLYNLPTNEFSHSFSLVQLLLNLFEQAASPFRFSSWIEKPCFLPHHISSPLVRLTACMETSHLLLFHTSTLQMDLPSRKMEWCPLSFHKETWRVQIPSQVMNLLPFHCLTSPLRVPNVSSQMMDLLSFHHLDSLVHLCTGMNPFWKVRVLSLNVLKPLI